MTPSNELWEQVKGLGIEHSNHASDLYIPVNEVTKKLISEYEYEENVTTFINQIDHKLWYDIPFAYGPFWENVAKKCLDEAVVQWNDKN